MRLTACWRRAGCALRVAVTALALLVAWGCTTYGVECPAAGGRSFDVMALAVTDQASILAGVRTTGPLNCAVQLLSQEVVRDSVRPAIYRSTDRGASWLQTTLPAPIPRGMRDAELSSISARPGGAIFASVNLFFYTGLSGGQDGHLFRSVDDGRTWTAIPHPRPQHPGLVSAVAAGAGRHVFALICSPQGGLYRSDDDGQSWLFTGLKHDCSAPSVSVSEVGQRLSHLFVDRRGRATAYVSEGRDAGGFFSSQDDGASWRRLPIEPMSANLIAGDGADRLVIATSERKQARLYRSDDRGDSWTEIRAPNDGRVIALVAADDGSLHAVTYDYVGGSRQAFRSVDGGGAWQAMPSFPRPFGQMAVGEGDLLVGEGAWDVEAAGALQSFGGAVHRSSDRGRTWQTFRLLAGDRR